MINISSWNILVPKFCNERTYPDAPVEVLDAATREAAIILKLRERTWHDDVICLQEVCRTSVPKIQTMFAKEGYTFIWEPYGPHGMGSALAIDKACSIKDIKMINISDTCGYWPKDSALSYKDSMKKYGYSWYNYMFPDSRIRSEFDHPPFWKSMKNKRNSMICALLEKNGETFMAASYHMPCHFGNIIAEQQMCCLTKLTLNALHGAAGGHPYVLGIDFNTKTKDSAYELATTGIISDPSRDIGHSRPFLWSNELYSNVRSLYKEVDGHEPEYTNKSSGTHGGVFCETIDYIFISKEWEALKIRKTSETDYMPNKDEPSDHLMIGGTIRLV